MLCCVLSPAPRPDGACAWCGEDLPSSARTPKRIAKTVQRRVFCGKRCSQEYQDDVSDGALSPFQGSSGGEVVPSTQYDGQGWNNSMSHMASRSL